MRNRCSQIYRNKTLPVADDSMNNLEPGIHFPISSTFEVEGGKLTARVYVFKRGKEEFYKRDEGVLFVINGQTHAIFPKIERDKTA